MADHDKTTRQSFAFRRRLLNEADTLLADAKALAARAQVEQPAVLLWCDAGEAFEQAAQLYRRADLGLKARHVFNDAGRCHREAGATSDAERCEGFSRAIPPYWEASRDE
jgi:hypothetical protein